MTIPSLPPEIILQILSPTPPLPKETLLSLSLTNKYVRNLILPRIYHTISCHFGEDGNSPKSRLPLLLRSLVTNPDLAGLIRTIDLGKWNVVYREARILSTSRGIEAKMFSKKEIRLLRRLLNESGLGEEKQDWLFEMLKLGSLDASATLVMFLVSKENKKGAAGADTGIAGLSNLHLKIEHDTYVYEETHEQPECMWKLLQHLLLPQTTAAAGDPEHNINDHEHISKNPFPFLTNVQITGKCSPDPQSLRDYSFDTETTVLPWLFHSSLKHLNVCLLDKRPFSFSTKYLHPPSNINLQSLTLSNVHLETLHSILLATPRLIYLSYTQLCNLLIPEHRWTNIDTLALALSCVRESLKSLTLRIFYYGDMDLGSMVLGVGCGPRSFQPPPPNSTSSTPAPKNGNLNLTKFSQLTELTTNLPLLVGAEDTHNKIPLSDVLPKGLQILRLVDEMKPLEGNLWELDIVKDLTCQYMRHNHHCPGSGLKRIEFLQEREFWNSKPGQPLYRTWPPADNIQELDQVAREVGIEIVYEYSWEWQKWHRWPTE